MKVNIKSCVEPFLQSDDEVLQKKGDVIKRAQIKCQMNENRWFFCSVSFNKVRKFTLNNREKHICSWENPHEQQLKVWENFETQVAKFTSPDTENWQMKVNFTLQAYLIRFLCS